MARNQMRQRGIQISKAATSLSSLRDRCLGCQGFTLWKVITLRTDDPRSDYVTGGVCHRDAKTNPGSKLVWGQRMLEKTECQNGLIGPECDTINVSKLKLLFEDWPHSVFALDRDGRYVFQNVADRRAFGDLCGKRAKDVRADEAYSEQWSDMHHRVLAGETTAVILSSDTEGGASRDAEVTMSPLKNGDTVIGVLGMTLDRSDARNLQRELEAAAEMARSTSARLVRLTDSVPGGIFEFLIDAEGKASFPYANSGMGPLLGTTTAALLADAEAGFANDHPDDAALVQEAIERSFETLEPVKITHRLIHPELGLRWHRVHATATRRPDQSVLWYGYIFDVTEEMARTEELERARNQMEELSLVDPLTGLPNRRAFDEEMKSRATDPTAQSAGCTVIRVDLDHFKAVNDTLGHAAGDAVLSRVGECLLAVVQEGDFAARFGGDEFVLVLAPGRTSSDANALITELRSALDVPFEHQGRLCRFDASFGVASVARLPDDYLDVLNSADAALLRAKSLGRGRVEAFTLDLHNEILHRRRRSTQIKFALERQEFVPFFQPQIDAVTGQIDGFEVLARWQHPLEGCLAPPEFIPVAEQMHVVQDIDRMMFEKALDVLDRLRADGFAIPKLSFNVSAARVQDPGIVESVKKLQTDGTRVAFELLESILLEDETELFAHHIDLLKECGVEIEVDDFGSGRASVIGVLKVAPDTLKIDRRLIEPIFENDKSRALLRAIIDIGHSMDIDITAEGVETMDHARALRDMGCKSLQGYAFARPMPEAALKRYLRSFVPIVPELRNVG